MYILSEQVTLVKIWLLSQKKKKMNTEWASSADQDAGCFSQEEK